MESIYNFSGKAGNTLYTQCIHKCIKTQNKAKQKAMPRERPRGKHAKLSPVLWAAGNRSSLFLLQLTSFPYLPNFL